MAVDQVTKWLALEALQAVRTIPVLPLFNLTLSFNRGVSFGLFRDTLGGSPWILTSITLLMAGGLLIWACRSRRTHESLALSLIAGGALGNAVDRIRQGAVTDFLDLYVGTWHWPTFNMADVGIVAGATLLVVGDLIRNSSRAGAVPG